MQKVGFCCKPDGLDYGAFRTVFYLRTDIMILAWFQDFHYKARYFWLLLECKNSNELADNNPYFLLWKAALEFHFTPGRFDDQDTFVNYLWETRAEAATRWTFGLNNDQVRSLIAIDVSLESKLQECDGKPEGRFAARVRQALGNVPIEYTDYHTKNEMAFAWKPLPLSNARGMENVNRPSSVFPNKDLQN